MKKINCLFYIILFLVKVTIAQTPIAYYPFNGNVNDESGNNNNGILYGPILTSDRFGNSDNAYFFDGVNDYIDFGASSKSSITNQISISCWIYMDSIKNGRILSNWGISSGFDMDIYNSELRFALNQSIQVSYNISNFLKTWVNIAVTYKNGSAKLFINGSEVASNVTNIPQINLSSYNFYAGKMSNGGGELFLGKIDEIRLYNVGLSQNQIDSIYLLESDQGLIEIVQQPVAPLNVCEGDNIFLVVDAIGENIKYEWYNIYNQNFNWNRDTLFINNANSNDYGMYYCKLYNSSDTIYSDTVFISINQLYIGMDFNIDTASSIVTFNRYSEQGDSAVWYFGDGEFESTMNTVNHYYKNSGVYIPCITLFDLYSGCYSTICDTIVIGGLECYSLFSYSIDSLNTVSFINKSSQNTNFYNWSFGDGDHSFMKNTRKQFVNEGTYEICLTSSVVGGNCQSEYCESIVIGRNLCNPDFNFQIDSLNNVQFHANSNLNFSYRWDLGNGKILHGRDTVYQFVKSGVYNICLTVFNLELNCQSIKCKSLYIGQNYCLSDFSFLVDSVTNLVSFNNNSNGDVTNYYWSFSDGSISNNENPSHTYKNSGVYNVCLTSYNQNSTCQSTKCKQIFIGNNLCLSAFNYFVNDSSSTVHFQNNSIGDINSYYWTFGDGTTSQLKSPIKQFTKAGLYNVCLGVRTSNGLYDNYCTRIRIGRDLCVANFNYFINASTNQVVFNNTSLGSNIKSYWTFGNGTFSVINNPSLSYIKAGNYKVCLSVKDTVSQCQSTVCEELIVGSDLCKSKMQYYINSSTNNVSFKNQSLGNPTNFYWTFGDGLISTKKEVEHLYRKAGQYKVGLSIYDSLTGCISNYFENIQIGEIQVKSSFNSFVVNSNNEVKFMNTSTGNIVKYLWDFGDGIQKYIQNPTYTYPKSGIYNVCLTVSNSNNKTDKYCENIQVGNVECNASFETRIDSTNRKVYFYNKAIGNTTNLNWSFGDGNSSENENPEYTYPAAGFYNVSLTVFDSVFECMDTYSEIILVGQIGQDCQADFIYTIDTLSGLVSFSNQSIYLGGVNCVWNFNNGTISTLEEPIINMESGYYQVCLTIKDTIYGCRNTTCKGIQVSVTENDCLAKFIFTQDSANKRVKFTDLSIGNISSWEWSFGDDLSSQIQNPSHKYNQAGYYIAELKIQTQNGCFSKAIGMINVGAGNNGIQAGFSYEVDTNGSNKTGYPVEFTGAAMGEPSRLEWTFDDGGIDTTTLTPIHTFAETGVYDVCLSISDEVTIQSDQMCLSVVVGFVDIQKADNFKLINLYPNPANSEFSIDNLPIGENLIQILDVSGKVIYDYKYIFSSEINSSNKVNLNVELKQGNYFITIINKNNSIVFPLIIVK